MCTSFSPNPMSFATLRRLQGTVFNRRVLNQIFKSLNRYFVPASTFKYVVYTMPYCGGVRFQHKRVDSSENEATIYVKAEKNSESAVVKKVPNQTKSIFPTKQLTKSAQIFENIVVSLPNEHGFHEAVQTFKKRDVKGIKMIDFISTAVNYMEAFGVAKNVDSYNQLLDMFPKGKYHNRTVFDTLWTRFRPQIDCAVQILTKLEENHIRPNLQMYDIVHAVFGNDSIPLNKLRRIVFWFDKFDEMYPEPLPKELPKDKYELFTMAINLMINESMRVSVKSWKSHDGIEHQVIGAENVNLTNLLASYSMSKPVFLEGPQVLWLRRTQILYYLLKCDINPNILDEEPVLALCVLGENEGESELKIWINELQKSHPKLAELNVVFNICSNEKF